MGLHMDSSHKDSLHLDQHKPVFWAASELHATTYALLILRATHEQSDHALLLKHRGYVVNWKAQAQIIDRACRSVLPHSTRGCSMLLTEPLFTLPAIQEARCQVRCLLQVAGDNA